MQTDLAAADRESIARVLQVLDVERKAMSGTSLAVLWSDWHEVLVDLTEGRTQEPVR